MWTRKTKDNIDILLVLWETYWLIDDDDYNHVYGDYDDAYD